jgi:uncharacterized protein YcaQ
VTPHRLDRATARRLAVQAQRLDAQRPTDLVAMVRHLTFLQIDPTAAVAPSADLVAWSRLGSAYRPAQLREALDDRVLWEHDAMVRPMEDLRLYLADMKTWPSYESQREWLRANDRFRRDILKRLTASGPLLSRDIPDTSVVPWPSSGWTNNRNVTQMLEFLMKRGEIAIAGRRGKQRLWDLAERVFPAGTPVVPAEEAGRLRDERRLRALGIARPTAPAAPMEPTHVAAAGELATVEGVPGPWRVDPEAVAALGQPFVGRTALLSPFDRLVHDRVRAVDLFEYEYVLEMYKPTAQRRWGYFALPILHLDRLVGKADVVADRRAGTLTVNAIHEDVRFTKAVTKAVRDELRDLADWLELKVDL